MLEVGLKLAGRKYHRECHHSAFQQIHASDLNDLLTPGAGLFSSWCRRKRRDWSHVLRFIKHGYRFDANQELLGIAAGAQTVMAGLGPRPFPGSVSGGMSPIPCQR